MLSGTLNTIKSTNLSKEIEKAFVIIAINNKDVREKLLKDRLENAEKVLEANEEVITKY